MARSTRVSFSLAALVLGWAAPASAQSDVADIPSKQLSLAGDPNLSYFLIGPVAKETPADGYGLIVVLPGGDGKADSLAFVKRVYKNSLGGKYIVAQPIAVKWSPQQAVVWPTQNDALPYVKCTTERFVDEIVKVVREQYKINPLRIFTMSWSSSGPAGYAISLQKDSPIVGSYIAMSVFKPDKLGPLAQARGHAYFIEHSPQDKICPLAMAQEAVRLLTAEGAKVQFNQYTGGHGWRGNVYPRISAAIHWLEKNAQSRGTASEKNPAPAPVPESREQQTEGAQGPAVVAQDSFDGKLNLDWDILNPLASHWSLSKHPGTLTITTHAGSFARGRKDYKNLFLLDCPTPMGGDFELTTCLVSFQPKDLWNQAGLLLWNDENHFLALVYEWGEGPPELRLKNQRVFTVGGQNGAWPSFAWFYAEQDLDKVRLRVTKRRNWFELTASKDGKTFTPLAPMRNAGDPMGHVVSWGDGIVRRIGLYASNGSAAQAESVDASFDFFEVKALPSDRKSPPRIDKSIVDAGGPGPLDRRG